MSVQIHIGAINNSAASRRACQRLQWMEGGKPTVIVAQITI